MTAFPGHKRHFNKSKRQANGWLIVLVAVVMTAGFSALKSGSVAAQSTPPGFPAVFYGTVVVDGKAPADGTAVRAVINGKECTQSGNVGTARNAAVAEYAITVPHESQTPGCGKDGAIVSFLVGGQRAVQVAEWKAGPHQVSLSVGAATPPPLPTATPRTPLDPTAAAATATREAAFTPLPAPSALPTDDPIFPARTGTAAVTGAGSGTSAPATPGASPSDGGNASGGSSVLAPLGAVVIVLLVAGAVGGLILARRKPKASE